MTHRRALRSIAFFLSSVVATGYFFILEAGVHAQQRGDGNNDGIPDSQQGYVTSLPNTVDQRYLTLVAAAPGSFRKVRSVHPESQFPNLPDVPAEVHLPVGLLSFELHDVPAPPNHVVTVEILLPAGLSTSSYWIFGREHQDLTYHWYEFLYDGATGTGAEIAGTRKVVLSLADGGRGDDDLTKNGVIVHCGGPVVPGGREKPRLNPFFGGVTRSCAS